MLQVINASPGNLAPVFDAMLEKALRLCESAFGVLSTYDGEVFHHVALRRRDAGICRIPASAAIAQGLDWLCTESSRARMSCRSPTSLTMTRTEVECLPVVRWPTSAVPAPQLLVPLRKDEIAAGHVAIFRQEVRPFTDKQIALLQNFAAQAVIAMENARLITEQREALEQQTATAEVLQVINASPGDLTPVFDAMLEKAMRLCEAAFGTLYTYDGERFPAGCLRATPELRRAYDANIRRRPARQPASRAS